MQSSVQLPIRCVSCNFEGTGRDGNGRRQLCAGDAKTKRMPWGGGDQVQLCKEYPTLQSFLQQVSSRCTGCPNLEPTATSQLPTTYLSVGR